jgi:hypothetical protein
MDILATRVVRVTGPLGGADFPCMLEATCPAAIIFTRDRFSFHRRTNEFTSSIELSQ